MSKIFLIGDTHAYLSPVNYHKWMRNLKEYFYEFYIPMLKENYQPGDICIHLGDLFDNRNLVPIDVLIDVEKVISEIASILPIHIIIGNHDIFTKSVGEYNLPKVYRHIPNVFVYEETTQITFNHQKLLLMPWIDKKSEQIEMIRRYSDSDYLFCHSDLNGAKMHLNSVAHKNNDKIDVEEFASFKHAYSGHIHIHQKSKNFTFVGSIYQMDRNDYENQKGVYILDTQTETDKFIPNNISPIFKKVYLTKEDDISKLDDINTSRDYVDLFISNTLLSASRKVRRKIESSLEKGNFASIEYINDLVVENLENKEKLNTLASDDKGSNIDYSVDFMKIVRDHIESMEFSSQKIKKGVLDEYMKVEEIYQTEYKIKDDQL